MNDYLRTWVEINLENIKHNVKAVKKIIPKNCLFMAVVKADGYGHGAVEVARAAIDAGADRLGIANVNEGKSLRKAGFNVPIHLLTGFENNQLGELIKLRLTPTVFSQKQAIALLKIKKPLNVHLKIDTGMGRIGLQPEETLRFLETIKKRNKNIKIEGLFTHFATADEENSEYAKKQLKVFKKTIRDLTNEGYIFKINHAANSAATILNPAAHLQMVRVGIALYGLHPSKDTRKKIDLKPALSWHSKLIFTKELSKGKYVSYGATYKLNKNSEIATIPVGYADGYNRALSNNSEILINNRKVKQVGRICMDQFMVNLNKVKADVGDKVTLIGKQGDLKITVDDIAEKIKTINYEVVCTIASRVPRFYKVMEKTK